jgi:RecA-family ATPase
MTAARSDRLENQAAELVTLVNSEAEQLLLGTILVDNRNFHRVSGFVRSSHFGNALHARIFEAVAGFVDLGKTANPITLKEVFDRDEALTTAGGARHLAQLAAAAALLTNPLDYARIVVELAQRRELVAALRETLGEAHEFDIGYAIGDIVARHESRLAEVRRAAPGRLDLFNPTALADLPVPERQWLVRDWIPMKRATGLYGAPGTGKTLLMQLLATAASIGKPWLGLPVRRCRSILHFCEDDLDEMHARQDEINRFYSCSWTDLDDMRWLPRVGEENTLMCFENGRGTLTSLFHELLAEAKGFGAGLVIEDTLADVFGGNEIERGQVRRFIQEGLARIAREIAGTVIGCGHPSQAGIKNDTGESGSTGWDGAFRSRLYLRYAEADENDDQRGADKRVLTRKKANWATIGERIELRWRDGVLIPLHPSGTIGSIERRTCERVFLDLLDKTLAEGQPVSSNSKAGNFAPRLFTSRPDRERYGRADFNRAMQALFAQRDIMNVEYGRKGDLRTRIARRTSPVPAK